MARALPSLSIDTILAIYSEIEIADEIARLKKELQNLYRSAAGAGKSGERGLDELRSDLESFGQAQKILSGQGGLVRTQATFYTGPSGQSGYHPGCGNFDGGSGC